MMSACCLCHGSLDTDSQEVSDPSQIEALQFLKLQSQSFSNHVCLLCYENVNYVASLRLSLQSASTKLTTTVLNTGASTSERPLAEASICFNIELKSAKSHIFYISLEHKRRSKTR